MVGFEASNSKRWALVLLAAVVGSAGCMLEPEATTENSRASVSVGGKSVWLRTDDFGWPGYDEVDETVTILRDDSSWGGFRDGTQVTIAGSRYAFPEWARNYGPIDVIELEADLGFWRGITTDLAIVLFHRNSGTRNRWIPVDCGLLDYSERTRRSDLEYYEPKDLMIDLDYREIQAKAKGGQREWVSFEACGVSESRPEFAAFVFPRYNWGNMEDDYGYTLKAWCDGGDCPAYEGDPTESTRGGSRSGYDSRYDSYGSGSGMDCRDPRAGANCTDTRNTRDTRDTRDQRYADDSRNDGRALWSASSSRTLTVRDDGTACASITVDGDGDARDVTLSLRGTHDYPQSLAFTLGHAGRVVDVPTGRLPDRGSFRLDQLRVSGFSGDASGVWKLCVEDTDLRHRDQGEITSWSVAGY